MLASPVIDLAPLVAMKTCHICLQLPYTEVKLDYFLPTMMKSPCHRHFETLTYMDSSTYSNDLREKRKRPCTMAAYLFSTLYDITYHSLCPFSFGVSFHCSFESDLSKCSPLMQVGYFLNSWRQPFLLSSFSGRRLQDFYLESLIPAALLSFKHPFDLVPALPWRMEDPMEKPDLWMPLGTSLML